MRFSVLSPQLGHLLREKGVILVGLDTLRAARRTLEE